jgi:uncharacterized protein
MMNDTPIKPYPLITEAIRTGQVAQLAELFDRFPEMVDYPVITFGTWLHHASANGTLEIVKYLVERGFDVNASDGRDGRSPLDYACDAGNYAIAEYLLDHGASLDSSESTVDILFGAIVSQSPEIVQLLLDRGIDSKVRYTDSAYMENMDATAFAMERGEIEMANMIALHNAGGDAEKAKALVEEADRIAKENNRWGKNNKFSKVPKGD